MRDLTICLPYYRNLGMLKEQCERLRRLPAGIREHLRLIVVDDGSWLLQEDETELPGFAKPAVLMDAGVPFQLFRIMVNVRWNQDAARNLAVHHAETEWVLLTDIDHIPTEATLRELISMTLSVKQIYRFSRQTLFPDGHVEWYKPHPNSWFLTKALYDAMGGYDERFAGYYGTDSDFKERAWARMGGEPFVLPLDLLRVPRETIPDASTTTWTRKGDKRDEVLKDMKRRRNATPGWQTQRLTFPWERVT